MVVLRLEGNGYFGANSTSNFDEYVEKVLRSNEYFGASAKFTAGNLLWRLQLASAYLLQQNGHSYNTYANVVPDNYVQRNWNIDDYE